MAGSPELLGTPGFEPMPAARRRFSCWTVVVPLTLTACVYVVASIIAGTRWTIGAGHAGPPSPARVAHAYTTRSGDTWRSIARRAHVSARRLHALNPRDTARGSIVPGEHLLLRP